MGRELKRKQAKRDGRNVHDMQIKKKESVMDMKMLLSILGIIVVFCIILYLITGIFITKDLRGNSKNNTNNEETNTVSNKILASDSLKQSEDSYYVYYYYTSKEDESISSIVSSLDDKVYRVDLHDGFNSNYVGSASGVVGDISDLRVESPTVIRVENGKMTMYYGGSDEIRIGLK